MAYKRCSRCKLTLDASLFYKNTRRRDGLSNNCKECSKEVHREWVSKNRERNRELQRQSYDRNREQINARDRERGRVARERGIEKCRAWLAKDKARGCEQCGAQPEKLSDLWYVSAKSLGRRKSVSYLASKGNYDKMVERAAQCRLMCRACATRSRGYEVWGKNLTRDERRKIRMARDPEYRRRVLARMDRTRRSRVEVNKKLVNRAKRNGCAVCGESDPTALDFHHVDPREKEFELSGADARNIDSLRAEIGKCVVLCANCHRKHHAGTLDATLYNEVFGMFTGELSLSA